MKYFMYGSVISSASENHTRQYNFHILSYSWGLENNMMFKTTSLFMKYNSRLSEQYLQFEPNLKCMQ